MLLPSILAVKDPDGYVCVSFFGAVERRYADGYIQAAGTKKIKGTDGKGAIRAKKA